MGISMRKFLLVLVLMVVSGSALALDRSVIADAAENVTPLLNGQSVPNTTLKTADGSPVSLQALMMEKPSIILFYRGGWCPYCNRQLAELKNIEQDLVDLGYQVLAISPESPDRLQEQKLETEFAVTLLSDASLDTIRQFGVGFYVPEETSQLYKDKMNIDLTKDTSSRSVLLGRASLNSGAVFVVGLMARGASWNQVGPSWRQVRHRGPL